MLFFVALWIINDFWMQIIDIVSSKRRLWVDVVMFPGSPLTASDVSWQGRSIASSGPGAHRSSCDTADGRCLTLPPPLPIRPSRLPGPPPPLGGKHRGKEKNYNHTKNRTPFSGVYSSCLDVMTIKSSLVVAVFAGRSSNHWWCVKELLKAKAGEF